MGFLEEERMSTNNEVANTPATLPSNSAQIYAPTRPSISAAHTLKTSPSYDPYDKRSYVCQNAEVVAATNVFQPSPKKRRKKASDDHGSKKCNCTKTKCLKLYYECFSSEYFCNTKTCGCQDCFNTRDYEDTIEDAKHEIKSRNPHAFVPKVVKGDAINSSPSSAGQTRGCICKKTRCIKRYCDCYENNIGCTNGCSCDNCENIYGKRGDYRERNDMLGEGSVRQVSGNAFNEKLQREATQNCVPRIEYSPNNFSSLASPIQFPNVQSPASRPDFYSPNANSPKYYQNNPTFPKSRNYSEGGFVTSRLDLQNQYKATPYSQNFGSDPTLQKSRNYLESGHAQKRLDFQDTNIAATLSQEYEVSNSFNQDNAFRFNDTNHVSSNSYLPVLESQFTRIQPSDGTVGLDENLYFRYGDDNQGLLDSFAPRDEVKSLSSGEISFSPPIVSLQGKCLAQQQGHISTGNRDDSENSNSKKK